MTLVMLVSRLRGATLSPPKSDPGLDLDSSNSPWVGERRVGDITELLESLLCRTGRGSFAKNVVMNEYSAVALSMRTNNADRTSASKGSFCR
ncbi:hypothetical protein ACG7TL_003790 [Trametes sanguinea]